MAYGDLASQLASRGATAVTRSKETKLTTFEYKGITWQCTAKNLAKLTSELGSGYEMDYCLKLYCERAVPLG